MIPQEIIIKKRSGQALTNDDILAFVGGFARGDVPRYQMSALAMAIFFKGMTPSETSTLTRVMMESGDMYDLSELDRPLVDKHSTGGVGDKISLILAPLAAACGLGVPMVSGRGLGHTGGTLDKLESIPGFNVGLGYDDFKRLTAEVGTCMIGQTDSFVPADKKLYALRDVTGTVESIPLIVGSILSKKLASGAQALVMDVKFGSGAFMDTREKAEDLARALEDTGTALGTPVRAILSDMNQPLGAAVGHTVEVLESLDLLRGSGPRDIRELTLNLVGAMLVLGGLAKDDEEGVAQAREKLDDGSALRVFRKMVAAQGGDASVADVASLGWRGGYRENKAGGEDDPAPTLDLGLIEPGVMSLAEGREVVTAPRAGKIEAIDTRAVGMALLELGGGRRATEDEVDHGAGIICHVELGDEIEADAPLYTILHTNGNGLTAAKSRLTNGISLGYQDLVNGATDPNK